MERLYFFHTAEGTVFIVTNGRRFLPEFEGDFHGSYDSVQQLIHDLAAGNTLYFPRGIDTSRLGLPAEVSGWEVYIEQNAAAGSDK
jgi:hypothetical protein